MFVVADVNEIWRLKPFQALSQTVPVMGVCPQDVITTLRRKEKLFPPYKWSRAGENYFTLAVQLPPSWASKLATVAQRLLWRMISGECKKNQFDFRYLVITTPHYRELLKYVPASIRVIYYVSDDYRQYRGWDPNLLIAWERQIMQRADFAFFVSQRLANRAKSEFPAYSGKIHVSMNATESSFLASDADGRVAPPEPFAEMKRPIVGVIGTINNSLDFDLLLKCADLPEIGTLLFVGPCQKQENVLQSLKAHPKVTFLGNRPHAEIPQWMQAIDVALIPYRYTEFNLSRSPMRLFDHLASGCPIVATSACTQVNEFVPYVQVANGPESFIRLLTGTLREPDNFFQRCKRLKLASSHTWENRMATFYDVVKKHAEMGNCVQCT